MFLISSYVAMWWCDPCVAYFCSFWVLQEHYYDAESGSGYLAWRIKTVQCNTAVQSRRCSTSTTYGPKSKRDFLLADKQLFGEECREAISLLKHSTDVSVVKDKMMATFQYRQTLVQDQQNSATVLDVFPRFLDIPGLVRKTYLCLISVFLKWTIMTQYSFSIKDLRCFFCRLTKILPWCLEKRFLADFWQNGRRTSNPGSWQTARTGLLMSMLKNSCLRSKTQMSLVSVPRSAFKTFTQQILIFLP